MTQEVQTRSEESGLCFFPTIEAALRYAAEHPDVWKLSFLAVTGERVRLVRTAGETNFRFEPIVFNDTPLL